MHCNVCINLVQLLSIFMESRSIPSSSPLSYDLPWVTMSGYGQRKASSLKRTLVFIFTVQGYYRRRRLLTTERTEITEAAVVSCLSPPSVRSVSSVVKIQSARQTTPRISYQRKSTRHPFLRVSSSPRAVSRCSSRSPIPQYLVRASSHHPRAFHR